MVPCYVTDVIKQGLAWIALSITRHAIPATTTLIAAIWMGGVKGGREERARGRRGATEERRRREGEREGRNRERGGGGDRNATAGDWKDFTSFLAAFVPFLSMA